MNSLLKAGCIALLALAAPGVLALGVGNLRVKSMQGAPLEAEIDLLASLDQMDKAWTVEVLEDGSADNTLAPEVFASLSGTVQRASDGSLFVLVRSAEAVAGPDISFRVRVASDKEALIARMSGTLLPLPKAPQMAQRSPPGALRESPSQQETSRVSLGSAPPAAVAQPPVSEVGSALPAVEARTAPASEESLNSVETSTSQVDAVPTSAVAAPAVPSMPVQDAPPAAVPQPSDGTPANAAPPVAAGTVPAAPPAAAPPAPSATAVAAVPPEDSSEPAPPWIDWVDFSLTQAITIAGGLAVLVVLLVMRRRLATIVLGRFSALRDEALKAQVASKIEAQASRQAQAANPSALANQAPAPTARGEADLNAEIDVLLAYAEYAKAEEKLQLALLESPNNVQARLRLAELRYITEDSAGFVAVVEQIQAHHRGDLSDEQWQKLTRMGKIVAPDAALFAGPRVVQRDAS